MGAVRFCITMRFESHERSARPDYRKTEAWRKQEEQINEIVDKLGKPVDPGIKETTIALRVSGLSTTASCEGHLDKQIKAPWVDIGGVSQKLTDRIREDWKAKQRVDHKVDRELESLRREVWERICRERLQLIELLDEFYRNRDVSFHRRLILKFFPDTARLFSQGAELQDAYPTEIQQERLQEYRDEMRVFTEFLRVKFFSGSD
jgi:hypothetical protein